MTLQELEREVMGLAYGRAQAAEVRDLMARRDGCARRPHHPRRPHHRP